MLNSKNSNATKTDNGPKVWKTAQKDGYFLLVLFYCIPKIINQIFSDKFWRVWWKLSFYQIAFNKMKIELTIAGKRCSKIDQFQLPTASKTMLQESKCLVPLQWSRLKCSLLAKWFAWSQQAMDLIAWSKCRKRPAQLRNCMLFGDFYFILINPLNLFVFVKFKISKEQFFRIFEPSKF